MTRLRGRAPRGQRLVSSCPHGHWRSSTIIGAIHLDGSTACTSIDGATNTQTFRDYVRTVLVPILYPGDIVVLDNLAPHKSADTCELINAMGATRCFRPAYSPDLNPIELMWSKIKALL